MLSSRDIGLEDGEQQISVTPLTNGRRDNMVKTKLLVIGLGIASVIIAISILYCVEVIAADWKSLGGDDDFSYFYDSTSISYPSKKVGRFWTKTVYKDKGRIKAMERFRENKELLGMIKNVDHTLTLLEIDCMENKFRTLSGITYSKDGRILKSVDSTPSTWKFIPPHTMYEAFREIVCK